MAKDGSDSQFAHSPFFSKRSLGKNLGSFGIWGYRDQMRKNGLTPALIRPGKLRDIPVFVVNWGLR
jgi:hypothetical protein